MTNKSIYICLIFCGLILNIHNTFCQNIVDSMGRKQGQWKFEGEFDSVLNIQPIIYANFLNDTLEGNYQKLDREAQVRYEVNMKKGKRYGVGQFFDSRGNLILLIQYENDTIRTVWRFDEKRRLYELIEYKEDKKDGLNILFYKNGRPSIKRTYKNGKLQGDYLYYKRNGNVNTIFTYEEDILIKTRKK